MKTQVLIPILLPTASPWDTNHKEMSGCPQISTKFGAHLQNGGESCAPAVLLRFEWVAVGIDPCLLLPNGITAPAAPPAPKPRAAHRHHFQVRQLSRNGSNPKFHHFGQGNSICQCTSLLLCWKAAAPASPGATLPPSTQISHFTCWNGLAAIIDK